MSLKGRKAGGKGSSGKYIEALKWKTLRRGVKLLGIVSHVSNKGLIVSLQNGLKGTVSKSEASDAFYITNKDRVKEKVRRSRLRIPRLKRNSVVAAAAAAAARKVAERKRKRKMEAKSKDWFGVSISRRANRAMRGCKPRRGENRWETD